MANVEIKTINELRQSPYYLNWLKGAYMLHTSTFGLREVSEKCMRLFATHMDLTWSKEKMPCRMICNACAGCKEFMQYIDTMDSEENRYVKLEEYRRVVKDGLHVTQEDRVSKHTAFIPFNVAKLFMGDSLPKCIEEAEGIHFMKFLMRCSYLPILKTTEEKRDFKKDMQVVGTMRHIINHSGSFTIRADQLNSLYLSLKRILQLPGLRAEDRTTNMDEALTLIEGQLQITRDHEMDVIYDMEICAFEDKIVNFEQKTKPMLLKCADLTEKQANEQWVRAQKDANLSSLTCEAKTLHQKVKDWVRGEIGPFEPTSRSDPLYKPLKDRLRDIRITVDKCSRKEDELESKVHDMTKKNKVLEIDIEQAYERPPKNELQELKTHLRNFREFMSRGQVQGWVDDVEKIQAKIACDMVIIERHRKEALSAITDIRKVEKEEDMFKQMVRDHVMKQYLTLTKKAEMENDMIRTGKWLCLSPYDLKTDLKKSNWQDELSKKFTQRRQWMEGILCDMAFLEQRLRQSTECATK